jgi:hypothetical protein
LQGPPDHGGQILNEALVRDFAAALFVPASTSGRTE